MSGWSGWEADILTALGAVNVDVTRNFLAEWQQHEPSSCRDNPMVASHQEPGSSNCKTLPNGKQAQRYGSTAQGIKATVAQLRSGSYPHLLGGLVNGVLWEPGTAPAIYDDLRAWGAYAFAAWYRQQFGANWGAGGPTGAVATHAHKGWTDLQHQVNRGLPTALHRIAALNRASLRHLGHRHRLR